MQWAPLGGSGACLAVHSSSSLFSLARPPAASRGAHTAGPPNPDWWKCTPRRPGVLSPRRCGGQAKMPPDSCCVRACCMPRANVLACRAAGSEFSSPRMYGVLRSSTPKHRLLVALQVACLYISGWTASPDGSGTASRTRIPFEAGSELWPFAARK